MKKYKKIVLSLINLNLIMGGISLFTVLIDLLFFGYDSLSSYNTLAAAINFLVYIVIRISDNHGLLEEKENLR